MSLVSVRKANLKTLGYADFAEWVAGPNNTYIGRVSPFVKGTKTSKWANPRSVKKYGMDLCLKLYEMDLRENKQLLADIHELDGKTLGCWCCNAEPTTTEQAAAIKCHGGVLLKLLLERRERIAAEAANAMLSQVKLNGYNSETSEASDDDGKDTANE